MNRRYIVGSLAVLWLAACSPATPTGPAGGDGTPGPRGVASEAADGSCPVTLPVAAVPGEDRPFASSANAYGNGELWVVSLPEDGVVRADSWGYIRSDGSIDVKFGWWRVTPGALSISGRRLDGEAPPLQVSIPDGYGSSGFQATGVIFPTEGCWEVTGVVGDATMSFVTFVARS
jgi:hypothetical protein